MITIQELLYNRGLDKSAKIKLVRHKDRRRDLYGLYRDNKNDFFEYQNTQKYDVFNNVEYIVSFIGEQGVFARFIGVFKVNGKTIKNSMFVYDTAEIQGFEDLKERVIIRWSNAISWHQWIKNEMEVSEITYEMNRKRFTDYNDVVLNFWELQTIVIEKLPDWYTALSSVFGIYLISDKLTGRLYVGSAYGNDGIWGRWYNYVETNGHGGNKSLKELIENDWEYATKNFQFSILTILPKTATTEDVVKAEQLFKQKLGTNTFGLNNN